MRHTNTNEISVVTGALSIFVYGTLKKGQTNYDRFCRTALCIEEAAVWGRLHELPSRIPVLQVPDSNIIAVGTSDLLADVATQERFSVDLTDIVCDEARWQMIQGELVTFPDPRLSLPPIDRLEGFQPELSSMYRRVLVPIMLDDDKRTAAWCYVGGKGLCRNLSATGKTRWP